ncbi:lytic transglycosylase domain-containing protein [Paraburkholderia sp. HD33-4]|uniref:lytic transglycosylase domain-containing protein n=1 Tax=Paraburkholderia sp. HD33-4 TaxID=2883242 RepID=UPI001F2D7F84|nr:lytic transglycosylase domain-containing protein [Paraburkholderia sp. HD33-4]
MTLLTGALLCTATRADCLDDAAAFHHVNVRLVRAIARVESGLRPAVTHVNADGSTDIGLMQINTAWLMTLSRYGVTRAALYDGCTSAYVGAWILARNIARLGLTWNAIGAYNATTPALRLTYARKVYRQLMTDASAASAVRPLHTLVSAPKRVDDTRSAGSIPRAHSGATLADWEASE